MFVCNRRVDVVNAPYRFRKYPVQYRHTFILLKREKKVKKIAENPLTGGR